MRRLLNFGLLLVLAGAIVFVLIKARLIPSPFGSSPAPDSTPSPVRVTKRDVLRVAVAQRPEQFLVTALQRLLEVDGFKVELVEFQPDTVWLELATGEIDLVFAPVGEAVKAQARFQAGHFLFYSGLSQGYDRVVARAELIGPPKSVGIGPSGGSELFALQQFPEAKILRATQADELSIWLAANSIDAAVLESARLSPQERDVLTSVAQTQIENPLPTVAVISRVYTQNHENMDLTRRLEVLAKALESWDGLVSYLDSQPELLRSTLKKASAGENVDIEVLLRDYRFLTPSQGREKLEEQYASGALRETLELLVLVQVSNLSTPDWDLTLQIPSELQQALQPGIPTESTPQASPSAALTPQARPETVPETTPSQTPANSDSSLAEGTFVVATTIPTTWPKPSVSSRTANTLKVQPGVSSSLLVVNTKDGISAVNHAGKLVFAFKTKAPLNGPVTFAQNHILAAVEDHLISVSARGKSRWNVPMEGKALPDILVHGQTAIVAVAQKDGGKLLAVDPDDGETVWETKLLAPPACSPILAGKSQDLVVVADTSGNLKAYNATSGHVTWTVALGKAVYIRPSSFEDKLVIAEPAGRIRLYSSTKGELVWTADLGSSLNAPPTATSDQILVPAKDTYLYSLKAESGDIDWKTRLEATLSEPAIVSGNSAFQSDESGKVYALELKEGTLLWSQSLGKGWLSRPVITPWGWALLDGNGALSFYKSYTAAHK